MAVSSANVLMIVLLDCGTSAVYIVYNSGPRTLFGVHPRASGLGGKFRCFMLPQIFCFVSMIGGG
jgi:hypothetical protein